MPAADGLVETVSVQTADADGVMPVRVWIATPRLPGEPRVAPKSMLSSSSS